MGVLKKKNPISSQKSLFRYVWPLWVDISLKWWWGKNQAGNWGPCIEQRSYLHSLSVWVGLRWHAGGVFPSGVFSAQSQLSVTRAKGTALVVSPLLCSSFPASCSFSTRGAQCLIHLELPCVNVLKYCSPLWYLFSATDTLSIVTNWYFVGLTSNILQCFFVVFFFFLWSQTHVFTSHFISPLPSPYPVAKGDVNGWEDLPR